MGDDSCLIFWDARVGTTPVVKVIFLYIFFVQDKLKKRGNNVLCTLYFKLSSVSLAIV